MKTPRVFYARSEGWSGTSGLKRLGVIMICLGVVGLFVAPGLASMLGLGIFNLVAVRWLESNPIVQLHSDHMEMKVAIAAPRKLVLFTDMEKLVQESANKVLLQTKQGTKIRLPVAALGANERALFLTELERHVAA